MGNAYLDNKQAREQEIFQDRYGDNPVGIGNPCSHCIGCWMEEGLQGGKRKAE